MSEKKIKFDMAAALDEFVTHLTHNKAADPITPEEKVGKRAAEIFIEMIGAEIARNHATMMFQGAIAMPAGPIPPPPIGGPGPKGIIQ